MKSASLNGEAEKLNTTMWSWFAENPAWCQSSLSSMPRQEGDGGRFGNCSTRWIIRFFLCNSIFKKWNSLAKLDRSLRNTFDSNENILGRWKIINLKYSENGQTFDVSLQRNVILHFSSLFWAVMVPCAAISIKSWHGDGFPKCWRQKLCDNGKYFKKRGETQSGTPRDTVRLALFFAAYGVSIHILNGKFTNRFHCLVLSIVKRGI